MAANAKLNFVRQQGLREADGASCRHQYPALMFQPKAVGALVVVGLFLQSGIYFLALGVVLWWNVALPAMNPFDAFYNHVLATGTESPRIPPAQAPRRFAQGMAGTFMLAVGTCLLLEWQLAAWILEGLLTAALAALIFGRFCLGSYLFHLFRGEAEFANRTLPWKSE